MATNAGATSMDQNRAGVHMVIVNTSTKGHVVNKKKNGMANRTVKHNDNLRHREVFFLDLLKSSEHF